MVQMKNLKPKNAASYFSRTLIEESPGLVKARHN